jgi:pyrroloquinoline quinone (PQQ) biosynthesis protein C
MPYCDICSNQCTFKHSNLNEDGSFNYKCYICGGYKSQHKLYLKAYQSTIRGKEVQMYASRRYYLNKKAIKELNEELLNTSKARISSTRVSEGSSPLEQTNPQD